MQFCRNFSLHSLRLLWASSGGSNYKGAKFQISAVLSKQLRGTCRFVTSVNSGVFPRTRVYTDMSVTERKWFMPDGRWKIEFINTFPVLKRHGGRGHPIEHLCNLHVNRGHASAVAFLEEKDLPCPWSNLSKKYSLLFFYVLSAPFCGC